MKQRYPVSVYPLWYRLDIQTKVALSEYQRENYGYELEIPPEPLVLPDIGQVEQIMRQRPYKPAKIR